MDYFAFPVRFIHSFNSDMMTSIGVSHSEARNKIVEALSNEKWSTPEVGSNARDNFLQRLCLSCFTVVTLALTYGLLYENGNEGNRVMRPGILFCLIVYVISLLISLASYYLRQWTMAKELKQAIHSLITHYELQSKNMNISAPDEANQPKLSVLEDPFVKLMSGHSHLSIINVFRNSSWQKIPALLLVEGDLIALMGGDITPCRVQQLRDENSPAMSTTKKSEVRWTFGSILSAGDTIPVDIINMHADGGDDFADGLSSRVGSTTMSLTSGTPTVPGTNNTSLSNSQLRNRVITPDSLEILKFSGNMRCFVVLDNPAVEVLKNLLRKSHEKKENTFFTNLRHQTEYFLSYLALASVFICGCIILLKRIFGFVFFANIVLTVLTPIVSLLIVFAPSNLWLLENIIETLGTAKILAVRWMLMSTKNSNKKKTDFDADEDFDNDMQEKHQSHDVEPQANDNGQAEENEDSNGANTAQNENWKIGPFHFAPKTDQNGWLKSTFRSNPVRLFGHPHSITAYYKRLLQRRWAINQNKFMNDRNQNDAHNMEVLFSLPFESSNFSEELGSISMVCFIDDDIICENNAVCEEVLLMGEENNEISGLSTPKYSAPKTTTEALAKSIRDNNANHAKCLVMDLHSGTVENGKRFENPLWWQQLPSLKPLGLACLLNHTGSTDIVSTPVSPTPILPEGENQTTVQKSPQHVHHHHHSDNVESISTAAPIKGIDNVAVIKQNLVQHVRKSLPVTFLKDLAEEIGFQPSDTANFTKLFEINVLSPKLDQEYLSQESHEMSLEESKRRGFLMPKLRSVLCKDTRGGFQLIGTGDPSLVLSYCKEYWDGNTRTITPLSPADRDEILQFYERWRLEDFEVLAFAYTPVPDSSHLESFIRHSRVDPSALPPTTLNAASLAAISNSNNNGVPVGVPSTPSGSGHYHMHHHHIHVHHQSHSGHHHVSEGNSSNHIHHSYGPKPLYFVDLTTDVDLKHGTTNIPNSNHSKQSKDHSHSDNHDSKQLDQAISELNESSNKTSFQPFSTNSLSSDAGRYRNDESNEGIIHNVDDSYGGEGRNNVEQVHSNDSNLIPASPFSPNSRKSSERLLEDNAKKSSLSSHRNSLEGTVNDEMQVEDRRTHVGNLTMMTEEDDDNADVDGDVDDGPDDLNTADVMNEHDGEGEGDGDVDGDEDVDEGDGNDENMEPTLTLDASASSKKLSSHHLENMSDDEQDYEHEPMTPDKQYLSTGKLSLSKRENIEENEEEEEEVWMIPYDNSLTRAVTEPSGLPQTIAALEKVHGQVDLQEVEPHEMGADEKEESHELRRVATEPSATMTQLRVASSKQFNSSIPSKSNSTKVIHEKPIINDHDSSMFNSGDHDGNNNSHSFDSSFIRQRSATFTDESSQQCSSLTRVATSPSLSSKSVPDRFTGIGMVKSISTNGLALTLAAREEAHDLVIATGEETPGLSVFINDKEGDEEGNRIPSTPMSVGRSKKQKKTGSSKCLDNVEKTRNLNAAEEKKDKNKDLVLVPNENGSGKNKSSSSRRNKGNGSYNNLTTSSTMANDLLKKKLIAGGIGMGAGKNFGNNKKGLRAVNRLHVKGLDSLSELHLRQVKRLTYRSLWNITRQQIFLGMVASSVPVREDVPVLKEALDAAGVRFIYFSPRNMKRSKPIAEKIGIPFDWNCAISLRDLGDENVIDPHRHISSYADWDVLARMPHGIEAIKRHIREVDNVPLLVSLFTDSTPLTIRQMLEIFREYGETVLAIGSGYRCYHTDIFHSSNIASSIATLPGVVPSISAKEQELFERFPAMDARVLTKADVEFAFRLVGLGTFNLIQCEESNGTNKEADLSKLVQLIRVGRQILENQYQIFGLIVTVIASLALTIILLHFVPVSTAPFLPLPMLLVYMLLYLPWLAVALLFTRNSEDLLRHTPRKRFFVMKTADRDRFAWYLFLRASSVAISTYFVGVFTTASVFRSAEYYSVGDRHNVLNNDAFLTSLSDYHFIFRDPGNERGAWLRDLKSYWLVQDMVMNTVLISLFVQCWTLQTRGYSIFSKKTTKWDGKLFLLVVMGCISLCQVGIMTYRALLRSCFQDVDFSSVLLLSGMDCDVTQTSDSHFASYSRLHWTCWVMMFIIAPLLNVIVAEYVNAQDLKLRTRHLQFLRLEFDTRLGMHSPR